MISKNLDTLNVYKKFLAPKGRVNIVEAHLRENGAKRVADTQTTRDEIHLPPRPWTTPLWMPCRNSPTRLA